MTYKKILLNLLDKWAKNEITEIDILEETEVLLEQTTWIEFKENNPQSIIFDVLSNLEALCTQLIIKEDIPAIIAFLNTPKGKEKKGWKDWKEYWDKIDFKNRQEFLRNHPFYGYTVVKNRSLQDSSHRHSRRKRSKLDRR